MNIRAHRNKGFDNAVKKWMDKVDALEVSIEGQHVSVLMHKNHIDYKIFIDGWLKGEITTPDFEEFLEDQYWWVGYSLDLFEREVFNL